MIVHLNDYDLMPCEYFGRMRDSVCRNNNVVDAKMGIQDSIVANIQGVMAEYAFAKHFNLFPDFTLNPRSSGYDGITRNGLRYDIKSTKHKTGNLLSTLKVNNDIDIYILAYVDGKDVEFIGWAYKDELINENNIKDLGYGKSYFLDRNNLRPFNQIK